MIDHADVTTAAFALLDLYRNATDAQRAVLLPALVRSESQDADAKLRRVCSLAREHIAILIEREAQLAAIIDNAR